MRKISVQKLLDNSSLGILSAKYESNGDPGSISGGGGDRGGASYGAYQFASAFNIPLYFVRWLKNKNKAFYKLLINAYRQDGYRYGNNFNIAWKALGRKAEKKFFQLQHAYIKQEYYNKAKEALLEKFAFDIEKYSFALRNVLWSRAVQHGPLGAVGIFKKILKFIPINSTADDLLIKAIYGESGRIADTGRKLINEEYFAKNSRGKYLYSKSIRTKTIARAKKYGIYNKCLAYFNRNSAEIQVNVWLRLNVTELNHALELLKLEKKR